MNELTCAEARDMASDLIHHELSVSDQAAVHAHMAGCPTCPGLYGPWSHSTMSCAGWTRWGSYPGRFSPKAGR